LKRHGHLYEKIYDFKNLHLAYLKARKNKRYDREVLKYTENLEESLINLQNELIWKTYKPRPIRDFYSYFPKKRLISAPAFYDRVLHHAINNIIEPIFDDTFISDNYACRQGKGTHAAVTKLQNNLKEAEKKFGKVYCLKADIAKYFPSIVQETLYQIVEKKIKDPDLLWLLKLIIEINEGIKGLGIGALTSQLLANTYLNELDHFAKEDLGIKYYIRYMDDFIILGSNKEELHQTRACIEDYIDLELHLKTNSKTQVFPANRGVTFLGYRVWSTHILIKSQTKRRIKKVLKIIGEKYRKGEMTLEEVKRVMAGYMGHIDFADTKKLKESLLENLVLTRENKEVE